MYTCSVVKLFSEGKFSCPTILLALGYRDAELTGATHVHNISGVRPAELSKDRRTIGHAVSHWREGCVVSMYWGGRAGACGQDKWAPLSVLTHSQSDVEPASYADPNSTQLNSRAPKGQVWNILHPCRGRACRCSRSGSLLCLELP